MATALLFYVINHQSHITKTCLSYHILFSDIFYWCTFLGLFHSMQILYWTDTGNVERVY